MSETLAALEFDRVLQLVAWFARSARGREVVMATLPLAGVGFSRSATSSGSSTLQAAGTDDLDPLLGASRSPAELQNSDSIIVRGAATHAQLDGTADHYLRARVAATSGCSPGAATPRSAAGSRRPQQHSPTAPRAPPARDRRATAGATPPPAPPFTLRRDALPAGGDRRPPGVAGLVLDARPAPRCSSSRSKWWENSTLPSDRRVAEEEDRSSPRSPPPCPAPDELWPETLSGLDDTGRVEFGRTAGLLSGAPVSGWPARALTRYRPALAPLRRRAGPPATPEIVPSISAFRARAGRAFRSNAGGKTVALSRLSLTALMVQRDSRLIALGVL
jgi:hypothetical protein